jgi:hypothetical protein
VGTLQTLVTLPAAQIENVNRLKVSGLCYDLVFTNTCKES